MTAAPHPAVAAPISQRPVAGNSAARGAPPVMRPCAPAVQGLPARARAGSSPGSSDRVQWSTPASTRTPAARALATTAARRRPSRPLPDELRPQPTVRGVPVGRAAAVPAALPRLVCLAVLAAPAGLVAADPVGPAVADLVALVVAGRLAAPVAAGRRDHPAAAGRSSALSGHCHAGPRCAVARSAAPAPPVPWPRRTPACGARPR